MLGSPKETASTASSKFKNKLAVWSLFGGTLAAVAGVIVYRFAF